jgi:hypothetical protein
MRNLALGFLLLGTMVFAAPKEATDNKAQMGKVPLQSIGALAFGKDHSLFIGDAQQAHVFNVKIDDTLVDETTTEIKIEDLGKKVAQLLGTTVDQLDFRDIATHPVSQRVYISVMRGKGNEAKPVLLRAAKDGKVERVALNNVAFTKFPLLKAPAQDAKDHRGRPLRTLTITEMRFHDDALYVAGLSNEEFASTLRRIPFPFKEKNAMTSLEVYHGAHGEFETHAPIRTFMHTEIEGEPHLLASYTCTPLVTFKQKQLVDGAHVKGKTIAELGAGNSPLAMTEFEWEGESYFLIANNRRGLMRISKKDVIAYNAKEGMTTQSPEAWAAVGVPYLTIPYNGIQQVDRLNEDQTVCLYRDAEGSFHLGCGTRKIWMGIFD